MTTLKDLHLLPKVRDSRSYLYIEHCKVEQEQKAIAVFDANGKVPVPCAALTLLMLGPGTNITHAAIRALAENGCLVVWTGEEGVRMYAQGMGETRSARNLYRQARLWADSRRRLEVVVRMYRMRFEEPLPENLTLRQIRGREGIRVRQAYARASRETRVPWHGRTYKSSDWGAADPINRALSCANSCLYGICHAAIISAGYSPALGFVHTGKMLSFVYDIADLYKVELTIPSAYRVVAEGEHDLERRTRQACRDAFHQSKLLQRILSNIEATLAVSDDASCEDGGAFDVDAALPGGLWDPGKGEVAGGVNHGEAVEESNETWSS